MLKHLNKEISTPIALTISLVLIVAVVGIIAWQYSERPEIFVANSCSSNEDCICGWPKENITDCINKDIPKRKVSNSGAKLTASMNYIWENMGCRCVNDKCVEAMEEFCQKACRDWNTEKWEEGIYKSAFVKMECENIIECECLKKKKELGCGCS